MKLLRVCVGRAREVTGPEGPLRTAIFKTAVSEAVTARSLGLEGDQQANLKVHGGVDKAVYLYPHEHYAYWHRRLPELEGEDSLVGENLTTSGLLESDLRLGDRLRIGEAVLEVAQPREPCPKLAIRMNWKDAPRDLQRSGRSGAYLRVTTEGALRAGDAIERLGAHPDELPTLAEVLELADAKIPSPRDRIELALTWSGLGANWKKRLEAQLR